MFWKNANKEIRMYKVYVIKQNKKGSEVLVETRTNTNSFIVARFAFWQLFNQKFDETHLLLMTKNNKQINSYRFKSKVGDRDYLAENTELVSD